MIVLDNDEQRLAILDALDTKIASLKRGFNTTTSPKFKAIYEDDLHFYKTVQTLVYGATLDPAPKTTVVKK